MPDASSVPVARSPILATHDVDVVGGWEVSRRQSSAPLRLQDATPAAKVLVRARSDGRCAAVLDVRFGRAERDHEGTLVVGSGPGEWTLLATPGTAPNIIRRVLALGDEDEALVSAVDITHGRALLRLTGADAAHLLRKLCAIDLADTVTPNGAAFRSSVAKLVTDVVRDDRDITRSYLLHCERSSGLFLFQALLDAGEEFGIEQDGFADAGP